jgi:hypothetical protein
MNTTIDKSEINQKELIRYGIDVLDTSSITKFKLLLDKRINLRDSDYTTMCDSDWIKHLRNSLVEMLNDRDNNKSL